MAHRLRASALPDGREVLAASPRSDDGRAEYGGSASLAGSTESPSRRRGGVSIAPSLLDPSSTNPPFTSSIRTRGALKIATLNMNGAHARAQAQASSTPQNKWLLLNQLMRDLRIGVLALQETHYTTAQSDDLNALFEGLMTVYVSPDPERPTNARGVAFALNHRVIKEDTINFHERVPGRALELELTRRRGTKLTILNVYAPNDPRENAAFWRELTALYAAPRVRKPDVLLGDFNVVDLDTDRAPARLDPEAATSSLRDFITSLGLVDGWRTRNGNAREFSFYQKSSGSQSRIDRIYTTPSLLSMSHSWNIAPSGIPTDHRLVSVALPDYNLPPTGTGRWRIPGLLLSDKIFLDEAGRLGAEVSTTTPPEPYVEYPAQWRLHAYKVRLLTFARLRAKELTPKIDRRIAALESAARLALSNPDALAAIGEDEAALLRSEADNLAERRFQSHRNRLHLHDYFHGETLTKSWMRRNIPPETQDPIYELESAPGQYVRCSRQMAEAAKSFYDGLQADDPLPPDTHERLIRAALTDRLPALNESQREDLETAISFEDVSNAIMDSAPHKAPGLDGIPAELWIKLHRTYLTKTRRNKPAFNVAALLALAFNEIEAVGVAPDTHFARGWICPIYKLKGDVRSIANYRPITVLNADYKLFTKAIAAKLAKIAPTLVHPDQAGFIPGRRIFDHTRLAQTMIDYAELCDEPGAIVALDQEKAYDRIPYLPLVGPSTDALPGEVYLCPPAPLCPG